MVEEAYRRHNETKEKEKAKTVGTTAPSAETNAAVPAVPAQSQGTTK